MNDWELVIGKKKNNKIKINEPCWFYNTGGCKNPDGSEKLEEDCKYQHTYSDNVKKPIHLTVIKPCDKFNLEGTCKWDENCKYSHRTLTETEWKQFYHGIPYQGKLQSNTIKDIGIESKIKILYHKINCMDQYYERKIKELEDKLNF